MSRRIRRLGLLAVTVAVLLTLVVPSGASAEPGDLDGAYGACGVAPLDRNLSPFRLAASETKLLELAEGDISTVGGVTRTQFVVTRRLRTGAIDRTFGNEGRASVWIRGAGTAAAYDRIKLDDQGRVVLALLVGPSPESSVTDVWLARLTPTGMLDATFNGGRVDLRAEYADFDLAPGGDVYGTYAVQAGEPPAPFHVRADGTRDRAFTLELPTATLPNVTPRSVLPLPAGGFAGIVGNPRGSTTRVLRWNADGSLDAGFTPVAPPTIAGVTVSIDSVAAIPGADDLVVGFGEHGALKQRLPYLIARVRPDGSYEPAFGFNGVTPIEMRADGVTLDVREPGITVAGNSYATSNQARFAHLTLAGALDPAFGAGGVSDPGTNPTLNPAFGSDAVTYAGTVTFSTDFGTQTEWVTTRLSKRALRAGAGLMLQWSGDAWPTRFGSDPGPECPYDTPYWPEDDLARGITAVAGKGGYVADAFGGVHPFSIGLQRPKPAAATNVAYWPGWDIVRGIAARADGKGGYTLDAFGGLHPFGTTKAAVPARPVNGPYWPGWDITRGVALMPTGDRGYLLDGFGGLHPFSAPGAPRPPAVHTSGYWPGWDIARGVGILPDGSGGYVVDAFGGLHPFGIGNHAAPKRPGPNDLYFSGEDWVRGFTFVQPMPVAGTGTRTGTSPAAAPSVHAPRQRTPGAPPPR